jgi:hypothetical protein
MPGCGTFNMRRRRWSLHCGTNLFSPRRGAPSGSATRLSGFVLSGTDILTRYLNPRQVISWFPPRELMSNIPQMERIP